jgi:hypothetical protein
VTPARPLAPLIGALAPLIGALTALTPLRAAPAWADELLRTLREGAIEIDGAYHDWREARRVSFEHHIRAERATPSDLRGVMSVAISATRLFVMVEAHDDDLRLAPRGDALALTLVGERGSGSGEGWRVDLSFDLAPLASGGAPRVSRGRRAVPGVSARGEVSREGRGGVWRCEVALPLSALPPLLGQRVGLAALLYDEDASSAPNQGAQATYDALYESVYATEVLSADLAPERARWLMGGNAVYRSLYEAKRRRPLSPLFELSAQVTGDAREEALYITDDEVLLLGADLPSGGTYAAFAHGWGGRGLEVSVEEVRWEVPGQLLRVARHERSRPRASEGLEEGDLVAVRVEELYALSAQGLTRVFAQVTEARVGSGRAGVEVRVSNQGREVQVSEAHLEGLSRDELTRALPARPGVTPLLGADGLGRARRYVRGGGEYTLTRR